MTKGKGMKAKGSKKQSFSQQTPITVDVKDDREASKSDEVTNLKSLNDRLVTTITNDRKGLKNEVNETRVLSLKHEEECIQVRQEKIKLEDELKELNNRNEELHAKMTENGCLWDTRKAKLESRIVDMQKKLNETKILAHNNQVLCNEISREKSELENNFNQSINEAKQVQEKIAEERHMWDICKREFEVVVAKLQNELNDVRMLSQKHENLWSQTEQEKNELEYNFNLSIDEARQIKEKIAEERHLWDTCKGEFEVTITKLQNELKEARMLNQKHEDLWYQSGDEKNELEKTLVVLQNELDETKILRGKDQELCNVLREENNRLGNKLKQCNDMIGELNTKIKEDELLWVSNKEDLERRVAGLQYEKEIMIQDYKSLRTHLTDEKEDLEHKLRECNDKNNELHAQMTEDCLLWEACKAKFEDSIAGLQNKLDLMTNEGRILSQEYVQLYIEYEFLKTQLGDYNDILSSMEDETWSLMSLSESKAKTVEALQTQVQSIAHEQTHLRKKYEELTHENESLKLKLENCDHRFDLVENERNSLRSMLASREGALIQEKGSIKQQVHELQNKLGTWANDYKRVSIDDKLDSATGERQLLTSLIEISDKVMEDLVTENRTVKQESLQLDKVNQALIQENGSLKQQVHELQNKLGMRANDYKRISADDMPHSATGERQLLSSLSETSDKVMEDLVTENRIVKQEALKLDQENQLLQKDIFTKKSLLHTKDGKITKMNAKMIELKNAIEVLEEIGRKNTKILKESGGLLREEQVKRRESEEKRKKGSGRVSNQNETTFIGNLKSCILPDISKSTVSKCSCTGAKRIVLPSDVLLCGCTYGWFGGIV